MAEAIEFDDEEKGKFIMITTFPEQIASQTHNIQIPGIQLPQNQSDISFIKTELDLPMFNKNIETMHEDNSGQLIEILSPNTNINDDSSMALNTSDDIFQVDKSDLIQTSNFGDFNSNDENFFNDFNFDDMWIPGAESFLDMQCNMTTSTPIKISTLNSILQQNYRLSDLHNCDNNNSNAVTNANEDLASCHPKFLNDNSISIPYIEQFSNKILSPILQNNLSNSSYSSVQNSTSILSSSLPSQSKLHDLLIKKESFNDLEVYSSIPIESGTDRYISKTDSCLSSSAPTHSTVDSIWQRREPRKHLLSTSSITDGIPNSSSSTAGGLISPEYSFDEGFNSEDDSEHYEDCTSDSDYEYEKSSSTTTRTSNKNSSKKERFFWQYNVQSKGPKGQRLVLHTKEEDPHNLNEIMDPVFSKNCPLRGLKHNGKARKGDGNDLTPNPKKLCVIGRELDKLTGLINGISSVKDRPHTRKEKNKLASRACRLKKKAQHEANKIKLYGLDHEHRNLINGIEQMKHLLEEQFKSPEQIEDISKKIEKIYRTALKNRIAGNTTEYVNSMLANVKNGISQIPFIHT